MAQGDGVVYNNFKEALFNAGVNLTSDTIKVALLTGHTVNIDTHDNWDDVSAAEVTGTGYTAGGETLGSKVVAQDNTNDRASFDGADVTWTGLSLGQTPSHAVMYKDTGTPGTSTLIAAWEVTTPSSGGNYTLAFGANGILLLT